MSSIHPDDAGYSLGDIHHDELKASATQPPMPATPLKISPGQHMTTDLPSAVPVHNDTPFASGTEPFFQRFVASSPSRTDGSFVGDSMIDISLGMGDASTTNLQIRDASIPLVPLLEVSESPNSPRIVIAKSIHPVPTNTTNVTTLAAPANSNATRSRKPRNRNKGKQRRTPLENTTDAINVPRRGAPMRLPSTIREEKDGEAASEEAEKTATAETVKTMADGEAVDAEVTAEDQGALGDKVADRNAADTTLDSRSASITAPSKPNGRRRWNRKSKGAKAKQATEESQVEEGTVDAQTTKIEQGSEGEQAQPGPDTPVADGADASVPREANQVAGEAKQVAGEEKESSRAEKPKAGRRRRFNRDRAKRQQGKGEKQDVGDASAQAGEANAAHGTGLTADGDRTTGSSVGDETTGTTAGDGTTATLKRTVAALKRMTASMKNTPTSVKGPPASKKNTPSSTKQMTASTDEKAADGARAGTPLTRSGTPSGKQRAGTPSGKQQARRRRRAPRRGGRARADSGVRAGDEATPAEPCLAVSSATAVAV
ncbi:hypothetical protein BD626DRAFT_187858 [Schizophyllum amplum]|uniref:Uncharacterized protein n=1 Tax=Schizophyllum amplum TaxID=97359 RepID=A0A550C056_9AGAR|nr:hypothetical protein BD626DRAFT_187858 [Auriculariopsis ampla]